MSLERSPPQHHYSYICKICKKVFGEKAGLLHHQKELHSAKPQIQPSAIMSNTGSNSSNVRSGGSGGSVPRKSSFANTIWKGRLSNSATDAGAVKNVRVESYAALEKPPPNLKPKMQQQSQSFKTQRNQFLSKFSEESHSPKSLKSKAVTEETDGESDEWKKWEPEKDKEGAMIISASVAQSTAACYSPAGSPPLGPQGDKSVSILQASLKAVASSDLYKGVKSDRPSSISPHMAGRVHIASLPIPRVNTISSKIHQPNSMANKAQKIIASRISKSNNNGNDVGGMVMGQQKGAKIGIGSLGTSANKLSASGSLAKGVGRIAEPKLMSKTKAQFAQLKSQVARPKIIPKTSTENALPRLPTLPSSNNGVTPGKPSPLTPPKLIKQHEHELDNEDRFKNPPQLLRQLSNTSTTNGKGATASTFKKEAAERGRGASNSSRGASNFSRGASNSIRGASNVSRGASNSSRGGRLPPPSTKRADSVDIKSRSPSPSPSPPPSPKVTKAPSQRGRPRGGVSNRGTVVRGRGRPSRQPSAAVVDVRRESKQSSSSSSSSYSSSSSEGSNSEDEDESFIPSPSKKSKIQPSKTTEKVIYGENYKCPALDKVASYLDKKGNRIWICLVCEEPELENSEEPMICCDSCEDWYHFTCVGIKEEPPKEQKWFCKRCIYKGQKSKLKIPAKRGSSPTKNKKVAKKKSSPKKKAASPKKRS